MGFDTKFQFGIYSISNKKEENCWGLEKCGFEINKEIKGNEAEKKWVFIQSLDLVYIYNQTKRKITLGFQ